MTTLLEQIQRDCINDTIRVSTQLLKVKLAASKLHLAKVEDWVDTELNGYTSEVPNYRRVRGTPMAIDPITGAHPMMNAGHLSRMAVGNSIASLEDLVASGNTSFTLRYPDSIARRLNKANDSDARYALEINRSAIVSIIARVRSMIMDWTTRLENAGVVGSEFTFTEDDKHRAQGASTHIHIGSIETFAGNLGHGNVSGSITTGIDVAAVRALVSELRKYDVALAQAGIDLNPRIAALEAELKKQTPDESRLRGVLTDVRNAVSGAAGNLIASGVLHQIRAILGA